ncbi:MAG: hypothetical protein WAV68_03075 [Candidatus Nanogingivalis sp.]
MKKLNATSYKNIYIIFLSIAVGILFITVWIQQQQINNIFETGGIHSFRTQSLEMDLRNRGIIDGEILKSGEYKPYSLEQMKEFKDWVENNK